MSIFYRAELNWNIKSSTWYSSELFNKGNIVKSIYQFLGASTITIACLTSANAQSKFEGFYGQVGVGYESTNPTYTSSPFTVAGVGSANMTTSVSNQSGFTGALGVGYYAAITKDFLLGLGAEYDPLNSSSANYNIGIAGYGTTTGTYKKQNSYNIFLSPATPIGTDGLLYGKVGYTGASIQSTAADGSQNSTNYTGFSLGAGYKQIIQGGLYGFGEVNYMNMGNQTNNYSGTAYGYRYTYSTTSSATGFNALVGIGYKF